ncbi:phosphoribosylformylglycinamidine synthase subunit PurS [Acidobacteria bacterium AH-259-L09]|nr:phosphoribosylformylglycinamidine synthase subunit PurS [Acidobacteria bacterium AH-259-L09]
MKAKVIVQLKEGVLDPQGQTIRRSLNKMGHVEVSKVRQGKYFEVEFDSPKDEQTIRQLVEEIAREVLSNPIIESFEIEDIS